MIDKSNEIFTLVAKKLRDDFEGITVMGEYVETPTKFPCVTIDEITNTPTNLDTAIKNKYAKVRYRVQVFSNSTNGKRSEARNIYNVIDECLQSINLVATSYVTTPTIYNSSIYQITAVHSGVIREDGTIYRQ